jgi:hypothetical protein
VTTRAASKARVAKLKRKHDRVHIVGFAPSWKDTPFDDRDADFWGLNALHRQAGDRHWDLWFQLHDIKKHHGNDEQHLAWLFHRDHPVVLWEEYVDAFPIPNAVPYPRKRIVDKYGNYFTNSISWEIALAIDMGYKEIHIYGVDMAQDAIQNSEYSWQRPSCEFYLGWARGAGIDIYIPPTSDLLKTGELYGIEDGSPFREKMEGRVAALTQQKQQNQQQLANVQASIHQIDGALEDAQYTLRAWSQFRGNGAPPSSSDEVTT